MADVLALPESERKLMNWLMRRRKASLTEITNHVGGDLGSAQVLLKQLFQAGFITTLDESGKKILSLSPKLCLEDSSLL